MQLVNFRISLWVNQMINLWLWKTKVTLRKSRTSLLMRLLKVDSHKKCTTSITFLIGAATLTSLKNKFRLSTGLLKTLNRTKFTLSQWVSQKTSSSPLVVLKAKEPVSIWIWSSKQLDNPMRRCKGSLKPWTKTIVNFRLWTKIAREKVWCIHLTPSHKEC